MYLSDDEMSGFIKRRRVFEMRERANENGYVVIETEIFPAFELREPTQPEFAEDIPAKLVERYERVMAEYDALRDELRRAGLFS